MFVPRRALFAARRLPTTCRPIARYATEASDVTLQKPDQDVTQVKQEDVVTKPKYTTRAKAAPSTASPNIYKVYICAQDVSSKAHGKQQER
ncbi:hypothetical protein LB505_001553 [Fusarium chuoi]|nr:hypothetical protein LB505_001553 [Fusarium chuoi]